MPTNLFNVLYLILDFIPAKNYLFLFSLPELTDTGGWPGGGSVIFGSPPFENQSLQTFQVTYLILYFIEIGFERLVAQGVNTLQRH